MKPADNMGSKGGPNTGKLKYQGQGSVGKRGSSTCGSMPRAQQTDMGKGVKAWKSDIPKK